MNVNRCPVQIDVTIEARNALRHLAIDRRTTVSQLLRDAIGSHIPEVAPLLHIGDPLLPSIIAGR